MVLLYSLTVCNLVSLSFCMACHVSRKYCCQSLVNKSFVLITYQTLFVSLTFNYIYNDGMSFLMVNVEKLQSIRNDGSYFLIVNFINSIKYAPLDNDFRFG